METDRETKFKGAEDLSPSQRASLMDDVSEMSGMMWRQITDWAKRTTPRGGIGSEEPTKTIEMEGRETSPWSEKMYNIAERINRRLTEWGVPTDNWKDFFEEWKKEKVKMRPHQETVGEK